MNRNFHIGCSLAVLSLGTCMATIPSDDARTYTGNMSDADLEDYISEFEDVVVTVSIDPDETQTQEGSICFSNSFMVKFVTDHEVYEGCTALSIIVEDGTFTTAYHIGLITLKAHGVFEADTLVLDVELIGAIRLEDVP